MEIIAEHIEELTTQLRKHLNLKDVSSVHHFSAQVLFAPTLAFIHAVDWTEPWIISLLFFHFFLLVAAIVCRKYLNVQMAIFLFGVLGVYSAEYLNTLLADNWTRFARQPYFDPYGIFLSTLWSGPLLIITSVILVNSLFTLAGLLVKWKRAELRHRSRLAQEKSQ